MIYMDHGATTKVSEEVAQAMEPWLTMQYANPSGNYEFSGQSKQGLYLAREIIAESIDALPEEIFFTSGGTESDNMALRGCLNPTIPYRQQHIITTKIEHPAVLNTCKYLEKLGVAVTYLDVTESGMIRIEQLRQAILPNTILISIMFANNEIGTIEPIKEIGQIAKEHNIMFHTDAVQAYGHLPISVNELGIDLLSASGHKFGGPKGIGFLYVRDGVRISPLLYGGGQEKTLRSGTENVPGIMGMAKAAQQCFKEQEKRYEYLVQLREHMMGRLLSEIPYLRINGDRKNRLPGNVNVSIQFVQGASMLVMLDMEGVCASAGSACSSSNHKTSHVLKAIGLPLEIAQGTLRFTLGYENTYEEVDTVVDLVKQFTKDLREFSNEYQELQKRN